MSTKCGPFNRDRPDLGDGFRFGDIAEDRGVAVVPHARARAVVASCLAMPPAALGYVVGAALRKYDCVSTRWCDTGIGLTRLGIGRKSDTLTPCVAAEQNFGMPSRDRRVERARPGRGYGPP